MAMALVVGIVIGVVGCFAFLVLVGSAIEGKQPPDPEVAVQLHALRRRRELDDFKRETKSEARRLRHELRQELRLLDDQQEKEV